jgi:site-specific recombinase XerD
VGKHFSPGSPRSWRNSTVNRYRNHLLESGTGATSINQRLSAIRKLAAGIDSDLIFRPVNKGDHLAGESVTAQAIYATVKRYAEALSLENLAVRDVRRTHAKLAHKGGALIDQIQLSLGHASIKTTEVYLGVEQDLTDAPCDRLGLRLEQGLRP